MTNGSRSAPRTAAVRPRVTTPSLERIDSDGEAQMLNQLVHGLSPTGQRETLDEASGRSSVWIYDELNRLEEERPSDPLYGNRTTV